MGIAILLLGLLPLAFLPDFLDSDSEGDDENSDDLDSSLGSGDLLDEGGDSGEDLPLPPNILNPIIEDDFDDDDDGDDDDDPDEDSILSPVVEDDEATSSDGEEGDVLAPVVEDDVASRSREAEEKTLNFPDELDAASEAENRDHYLDARVYDQEPTSIENFQVGEDILFISVDPSDDEEALEIVTKPSSNGVDGLVFIGGELVAVIEDSPNVSAQDVFVEIDSGNN